MANSPILFQNHAEAVALIAGVPAAARAIMAMEANGAIEHSAPQILAVSGDWGDTHLLATEIVRLSPNMKPIFQAVSQIDDGEVVDGLLAATRFGQSRTASLAHFNSLDSAEREVQRSKSVKAASWAIIRATGKSTDGYVSQYLNRPVSRFLSFHLLKLAWIRPNHATIATAVIGLAMALCLFLGGEAFGHPEALCLGAILFQIASIVDGVDGEIARATKRSSKFGASLDTAVDAATNFTFIAGVSANLWWSGDALTAAIGFASLAMLMLGIFIAGASSVRGGNFLSFEAIKQRAGGSSSNWMRFFAKTASRDFYAFGFAVLILLGFAQLAMFMFATVVAVWLPTLIFKIFRHTA